MNNVLSNIGRLFKLFFQKNNNSLLLIDGDGISPKYLHSLLEGLGLNRCDMQIRIFCNTDSARSWVGCKKFTKAQYILSPVEPQSADLKIKTKFIRLLTEQYLSGNRYHKNIYLAVNDTTFYEDIENLAKVFNITLLSSTQRLLNIKNVNAVALSKPALHILSHHERSLIKVNMPLVQIGHLFKINGIKYHIKLSDYLTSQGIEVANGIVIRISPAK